MRKFTLFFMSLFLTIGAMAQYIPSSMDIIEGHHYTIKFDKSANTGFAFYKADGGDYLFYDETYNSANASNTNYHFVFTLAGHDGQNRPLYYISPANATDYYAYDKIGTASGTGGGTIGLTNNETMRDTNGKWYIFNNGTNQFITPAYIDNGEYTHCHRCWNPWSASEAPGSIGMYGRDADDHYDRDQRLTITNVTTCKVTYRYSFNGNIVKTEEYTLNGGASYPTPASYYAVTYNNVPQGRVERDGVFTINTNVGEYPFEFSSSYENAIWYNLVMHSNQGKDSHYRTYLGAGNETTLAWGTNKTLTNANNDYYWAFVGDPINGFRVVNKGKGNGYILSSDGNKNPILLQEENLTEGYNTTWAITARTTNSKGDWVAAGDWFCLKYRNNWYLNANAGNGTVNFWNSDDNGSGILAVKPIEINAAADVATYFSETAISIPETAGIEVYYASGINEAGYMGLEPITGIVAPETGIVVRYKTDENITFAPEIVSPGTATTPQDNLLKGTTKKTLFTKEAGKSYYALGLVNGEVGFYNAVNGENTTEFYNNAFKAYLEMPAQNGSAAFYGFDWANTTAIENVEVENASNVIYDLTGRKVEAITAPGIYIVGGKKVLVK